MKKDQIKINDYIIDDGDLTVDFIINDEEGYRLFEICVDELYDFLTDNEYLEMFSDEWDYAKESHYTRHWTISVDEYMSDYFSVNELIEFMYTYFDKTPYPQLQSEDQ